MKPQKICIVGQGLAGTILAHKLEEKSIDFSIYNMYEPVGTSSWVAGGLFNPVTGRKIQKSWMAGPLFDELWQFYPKMETKLNASFFHPRPMLRIFDSIRNQNEGLTKVSSEDLTPFTSLQDFKEEGFANPFSDPFGSLEIKMAGYLDSRLFLESSRSYFQSQGRLIEERFNPELTSNKNFIFIWCTGVLSNPVTEKYQSAFKPVKGEVLTVSLPDISIDRLIVGNGIFLVPLHDGMFRLGATYNWDISKPEPTENAASELIAKFYGLLGYETKVVIQKHEAGIRPATKDRRPIIGSIDGLPNYYIFNGFGSKGVSLIPYFADVLISHLFTGSPIPEEVHPDRFKL